MSNLKILLLLGLVGVFIVFAVSMPLYWVSREISGVKVQVESLNVKLGGTTGELEDLNKKFKKSILF